MRGSLRRTPRVRVVERHVHLAVPHDRLYYRGVFLFVHQASSQRMAKRVKAEALHDFAVRPVGDAVLFANHASTNCCWAKVILDQLRSASRLLAAQLLGREREVLVIGIQCFLPPSRKSIKQQLGCFNTGAGQLRLGTVLNPEMDECLTDGDPPFVEKDVPPFQTERLADAQSASCDQQRSSYSGCLSSLSTLRVSSISRARASYPVT